MLAANRCCCCNWSRSAPRHRFRINSSGVQISGHTPARCRSRRGLVEGPFVTVGEEIGHGPLRHLGVIGVVSAACGAGADRVIGAEGLEQLQADLGPLIGPRAGGGERLDRLTEGVDQPSVAWTRRAFSRFWPPRKARAMPAMSIAACPRGFIVRPNVTQEFSCP